LQKKLTRNFRVHFVKFSFVDLTLTREPQTFSLLDSPIQHFLLSSMTSQPPSTCLFNNVTLLADA